MCDRHHRGHNKLGRALISSLVQALDDPCDTVRTAASRALVDVSSDAALMAQNRPGQRYMTLYRHVSLSILVLSYSKLS